MVSRCSYIKNYLSHFQKQTQKILTKHPRPRQPQEKKHSKPPKTSFEKQNTRQKNLTIKTKNKTKQTNQFSLCIYIFIYLFIFTYLLTYFFMYLFIFELFIFIYLFSDLYPLKKKKKRFANARASCQRLAGPPQPGT